MTEPTDIAYWHTQTSDAISKHLKADIDTGLDSSTANQRINKDGFNEIIEEKKPTLLKIFVSQFIDLMIVILIAAAVISGILGSLIDAGAIVIIVLLNAIVGTVQQHRAYNAIAALKTMASPQALVIRESKEIIIPARELVQGDIVLLEAGDIVPADIRLIYTHDLEINESALTGESLAISKDCNALCAKDTTIADRQNMAYKSTMITRGRAKAIVVETGMQTEIGKIATLLSHQEILKTPLQKRLTLLGKRLALFVLAICLLIFIAGLLRNEPVLLMFLTSVSLAVAAIPEALPAIITVSLAFGAVKISRQFALVRNLPAVETLGSVTYICTDKTGTLTQNKMQLEKIIVNGQEYENIPSSSKDEDIWHYIGLGLALNNDVILRNGTEINGEPTELALYNAAEENGYNKLELESMFPRVAELAFDSQRKCMTTLHNRDNKVIAFTKGAPEVVLPICQQQLSSTGNISLEANEILQKAEELAAQGYRVLAFAYREYPVLPDSLEPESIENQLTFLALVALVDPPRPEAKDAVNECIKAGITPVMITGDHKGTAIAIAKRIGIADSSTVAITGEELANLSMDEFEQCVTKIRVYARVSPEQKTIIVKALQDKGQFVAMTGDGVNDAPALKRSDIGVAMGKKGTAVAREASDMILLDDNFATIVAAVREGRRIYDNIRKFLKYIMTGNIGEILTLLLAPFLGLPLPLLPIHILWINLVTDGLPGLALSLEKAESNIMQRPPRPPGESMFAGGMWQHMLWIGFLIAALTITSQAWAIQNGSSNWQTIVFTVLTFSQLVNVMVIRSETESIFKYSIMNNKLLLGAIIVTVLVQLAIIYIPLLNSIFQTSPLTAQELLICFVLPMIVLIAVETEKWYFRKQNLKA